MNGFKDLGQRVRTHLCYAHVFGDALTDEQVVARCAPGERDAVLAELRRLEAIGDVEYVDERWFLRGEVVRDLPRLQERSEISAERILEQHRLLLGVLKRMPIVRLLAVSGSVAWRNHGRRNGKVPDLDLFVISAPGGVHVVRLFLRAWDAVERALQRVGLLRNRAPVCPSYLTDAAFLDITNKSFYTASDALMVEVLKGSGEFQRFLAENSWIARYYPIDVTNEGSAAPTKAGLFLSVANAVCFGILAGSSWLKMRWSRWRTGEPPPVGFQYSWRFQFDTNVSWLRSAPAGGGHQPQVARRFHEVYSRHFGSDETLQVFLFPGTTTNGVYTVNGHAKTTILKPLGYHE
jgi:hypothetical protein